jgi:hypothetical protein
VFLADIDRLYAKVEKSFIEKLDVMVSAGAFTKPARPRHPIHRKLLERVVGHEVADSAVEEVNLLSVRQHKRPSLQVVYFKGDRGQHYAELDLDLGNPLSDLFGLVIHLGEVLNRGRTDHLNLHEDLSDDPDVSPFLFYNVVD